MLLMMLSLGERQAAANGLRMGVGIVISVLRGGSHFALAQNGCHLNCLCATLNIDPAFFAESTYTAEERQGGRIGKKTPETQRDIKQSISPTPSPATCRCTNNRVSMPLMAL